MELCLNNLFSRNPGTGCITHRWNPLGILDLLDLSKSISPARWQQKFQNVSEELFSPLFLMAHHFPKPFILKCSSLLSNVQCEIHPMQKASKSPMH